MIVTTITMMRGCGDDNNDGAGDAMNNSVVRLSIKSRNDKDAHMTSETETKSIAITSSSQQLFVICGSGRSLPETGISARIRPSTALRSDE